MPRKKELREFTPPALVGFFWYSKRQREELDKKGHDRMFCQLTDKSIKEYTELIERYKLEEDPYDRCFYEDAVPLGWGHIHSLIPCGEQELKVEI